MNDLKGASIKAVWTMSTHYFAVLLLVSICISVCITACQEVLLARLIKLMGLRLLYNQRLSSQGNSNQVRCHS